MRIPTTEPTPVFDVGDFVVFRKEVCSDTAITFGVDRVVLKVVAFDQQILKYKVASMARDYMVWVAGSFLRLPSDVELLRYRLTNWQRN